MKLKYNLLYIFFITLLSFNDTFSQGVLLEGYTFETGNRGYLSQVDILLTDNENGQVLYNGVSDNDGHFSTSLPPAQTIKLVASKGAFKTFELVLDMKEAISSGKKFLKIEMERSPGYLFEITIADKKDSIDQVVDAIKGAQIEVYNNTTQKEVLKLEDHPNPEFKIHMEKGNHYTILIRKKGYIAKQMEAYVNVKGCILCFEGVNDVRPGVSDNLTSGNQYGVLVANVEMEKLYNGKSFDIQNIYYDLGKWSLKKESKKELEKIYNLLKYNPNLTLELGSHTDSRGSSESNQILSEKRASTAVEYILSLGTMSSSRIYAHGYGESYLRNECGDGKTCTEAEHAINRRTEIKIVGINDDWIFKPLVNLKNEERMEAEILKGNNEEISEEEFKKLMDKDKIETSKEVDKTVKNTVLSDLNKTSIEENVNHAETSSSIKIIESNDEITGQLDKTILVNENPNSSNVVQNNQTMEPKVIDDMPEDALSNENKTLPSTKVSDGYKIVIHFTTKALPSDHKIFKENNDLEVYINSVNNIYYLVKGFKTEAEAKSTMVDKYLNDYPSAYVIGFRNGRRIK